MDTQEIGPLHASPDPTDKLHNEPQPPQPTENNPTPKSEPSTEVKIFSGDSWAACLLILTGAYLLFHFLNPWLANLFGIHKIWIPGMLLILFAIMVCILFELEKEKLGCISLCMFIANILLFFNEEIL